MNELKFDELQEVNSGSWKNAGKVIAGTIGVAASLPVGALNPLAGASLAVGSLSILNSGAKK